MNLYAIRDKKTGSLRRWDGRYEIYDEDSPVIQKHLPSTSAFKSYWDDPSIAVITFQEVPTKPCIYCYNDSTGSKFCHMCGRRLK